jgi:cytochrome c peroxidase
MEHPMRLSRVTLPAIVLVVCVAEGIGAFAADAGRTLRLPETPFSYGRDPLPAHFRTPAARTFDSTPATNPVTDWGATLGRVLFYDTRLSANDSVSCASCHQQSRAFADSRRFLQGHA